MKHFVNLFHHMNSTRGNPHGVLISVQNQLGTQSSHNDNKLRHASINCLYLFLSLWLYFYLYLCLSSLLSSPYLTVSSFSSSLYRIHLYLIRFLVPSQEKPLQHLAIRKHINSNVMNVFFQMYAPCSVRVPTFTSFHSRSPHSKQ